MCDRRISTGLSSYGALKAHHNPLYEALENPLYACALLSIQSDVHVFLNPPDKPLHARRCNTTANHRRRPWIPEEILQARPERIALPLPGLQLRVLFLVVLGVPGFLGRFVFLVASDVAEEPAGETGQRV